jgi:single-stranded-DNA-specific exonuclease
LDDHNRQRRVIEAEVLARALARAESHFADAEPCSLVLSGENWHPGVLGIVASRIVERFYRPTVIIGLEAEQGKGSARSIRGFNMVDSFRRCAAHLEKFGGHEYAGGLSIRREQIEPFAQAFETVARETLTAAELRPRLEIDAQLTFAEIGIPLIRDLACLQPFGVGNPEPVFMTETVEVCERKPFSAGVRFRFRQDQRVICGVAFGAGDDFPGVPGSRVDVAYRLSENHWNGTSTAELKLLDVRLSNENGTNDPQDFERAGSEP